MSRCAIFSPDDGEYFGGLDLGWTKQLRFAFIYPDEKTAMRTVKEWRAYDILGCYKLVGIHWRIRNAEGDRVCDRGSIAECQTLVDAHHGLSGSPYKISRVAHRPKAPSQFDEESK